MNREDYMEQQRQVAERTNAFLTQWGLKQMYVAEACRLSQTVLSKFLHHKLSLSKGQLSRLITYMSDYEKRNG